METIAVQPFWGEQTSYLNFCEEDYGVTRYIAEFINTLSSLTYVIYGIYGLTRVRWEEQSISRLISYCGLIGVGVCSGGYHMTLKYQTQMSDELSMHLLTTPLIYRLLAFRSSSEASLLIGIVLANVFFIVMLTHMLLDEFLLHATSFGLGILIITIRAFQLIPRQFPDAVARSSVQKTARLGCFSFLFGFLVWLVDENMCPALTSIKQSVGLPASFLLELHGWWHIFTAIGGYVAVVLVDAITSGEDPGDNLPWPIPWAAQYMTLKKKRE